jgi:hypothetical protein
LPPKISVFLRKSFDLFVRTTQLDHLTHKNGPRFGVITWTCFRVNLGGEKNQSINQISSANLNGRRVFHLIVVVVTLSFSSSRSIHVFKSDGFILRQKWGLCVYSRDE